MKTSELTGAQLDYWVAKANSDDVGPADWEDVGHEFFMRRERMYSTNWSLAGPIIERERITIKPREDEVGPLEWAAFVGSNPVGAITCWGRTPLIAAMRAYVASKFGEDLRNNPA